jgi:serine protease Do
MVVEPLDADTAREVELPRGKAGVLVSNVSRSGAAANAGVQPNDVILEINRTPVSSVSQVTRELERAPAGSTVFMVVWRVGPNGGQENFLTLRKR